MNQRLKQILKNFQNKKILVIGDIMLDKYFYGEVTRISPEAPIPIVNLLKEKYEIGGAGNVASNITSLGGQATIFAFAGQDEESKILKQLLQKENINHYLNLNKITTCKSRIIANQQQIGLRLDKEETEDKTFNQETKNILLQKAEQADKIIISDYSKGTITQDLINLLHQHKHKIIADLKPKNKHLYKNLYLIKPNEKEALEMANNNDIHQAGEKLKQEFNSNILITRGNKGMILFSDEIIEIPTYAKEIYDVSGAGDSVIAALALALSSNASLHESAIISNYTAGIAVEKHRTHSVNLEELKQRIFSSNNHLV
jgi:D-glycero-beta-D-manno-heptose-7-phosphate kinase